MNCKICNEQSKPIFTAKVLKKYNVQYFYCEHCGFLFTEEPYWINEAYERAITCYDTGIMQRNLLLSRITAIIIYKYFDADAKYLDYAGGHGILTRLMRDKGFNYYWDDKYAENLLAHGFEWNKKDDIHAITTFEAFEHFVNPLEEIEKLLSISKNIIFSTEVVPITEGKPPNPKDWWYYVFESGQHISFYSNRTLNYIAEKYRLNYYSILGCHVLTTKKLCDTNNSNIINKINYKIQDKIIQLQMKKKSKTLEDMKILMNRTNLLK